jgi:hypothetical protein
VGGERSESPVITRVIPSNLSQMAHLPRRVLFSGKADLNGSPTSIFQIPKWVEQDFVASA